MKKLILTILALCMCLSIGLALVSCDEPGNTGETSAETGTESSSESDSENENENENESATESDTAQSEVTTVGPEGISKEQWQDALAQNNFTNVTIYYTLVSTEGEKQEHVVKITPDKVYRKVTMTWGDETDTADICYTGEEAAQTAQMFINVFLGLLKERDNFVYDFDAGVYNAPEEVVATAVEQEGYTVTESMKNGKVKFDLYGNLEYFTCDLTESISHDDGDGYSLSCSASWTFADYNKTVITDKEMEAIVPVEPAPETTETGGDVVETVKPAETNNESVETSGTAESDTAAEISEDEWQYAISSERFDNVTFNYGADFTEGDTLGHYSGDFQLNGNDMLFNGSLVTDPQQITATREGMLNTAILILKDFDAFTIDPWLEYYVSTRDIVYEVTVMGYDATVTASDVAVWFDENNLVSAIKCTMTQEFEEDGVAKKHVFDVCFSFSEYGTTVVEVDDV